MVAEFPTKITLRAENKLGPWKWCTEYLFLCRWQSFKNDPRGQMLILKALAIPFIALLLFNSFGLLVVTIIVAIFDSGLKSAVGQIFTGPCDAGSLAKYLSVGSLVKAFSVYLGAASLVYWNINRAFQRSWQYCANQYNQIISKSFSENNKAASYTHWAYMRSALAIDVLIHDFWAQRAFSSFFSVTLKAALYALPDDERDRYVALVVDKKLTEDQALRILEDANSIRRDSETI